MGSSVNDRELVLETLLLITKEGEYSHIALKKCSGSISVSG